MPMREAIVSQVTFGGIPQFSQAKKRRADGYASTAKQGFKVGDRGQSFTELGGF